VTLPHLSVNKMYFMLYFRINKLYLLYFIFGFIFITPIGTILHEYGHIIVAQLNGYTTKLHYGSMSYTNEIREKVHELYNENVHEIENNLSFKNKTEYYSLLKEFNQDSLMIYSGGILQTIMIGTISFIILLFKKSKNKSLSAIDWVLVFLSLFWLREVFILLSGIIIGFASNKDSFFNGDEAYVSSLLGIYKGSLSLTLGIIGILISSFIAFKIIPKKIRLSFILGGAIGSLIGFFIWMNIAGPYLLP